MSVRAPLATAVSVILKPATLIPLAALIGALCLGGCSDTLSASSPASPPPAEARLVGSMRCEVHVHRGTTACVPTAFRRREGPSSITAGDDTDWRVRIADPRYEAADSVFSLDLALDNGLSTVIGTRDGGSVLGFQLFLAENPTVTEILSLADRTAPNAATGFSPPDRAGTVRILNPDGRQGLLNADQPYFSYAGVVPAGQTSSYRTWRFHVPGTVAAFSFTVQLFAATPGEVPIPAEPPVGFLISDDSLEALYADRRLIFGHERMAGPYPPDLVMVTFVRGASQPERQAAIDLVRGSLIGGAWDAYYILVPPDGTPDPVWQAVDVLSSLPQVHLATPDVMSFIQPSLLVPERRRAVGPAER